MQINSQTKDKMKEGTAFSPGHITGFFQICRDEDSSLKTGSRGAGVSITRGVITRVAIEPACENRLTIFFNGLPAHDPHVSSHLVSLFLKQTEIKQYGNINVFHYIDIPVGYGLGSSGAGALSLVMSLDHAMGTSLSRDEQISLAHRAEVEMKTGLGTVTGESCGGIEIREKAGAPGYGKVSRLAAEPFYKVICLLFGSLSTSSLLSDPEVQRKVNACGGNLVDKLTRERSLEKFMLFSREFAYNTGLVNKRLDAVINGLAEEGIPASMLMFGDGVFIIEKENKLDHVMHVLARFRETADVIISEIDFKGARLI